VVRGGARWERRRVEGTALSFGRSESVAGGEEDAVLPGLKRLLTLFPVLSGFVGSRWAEEVRGIFRPLALRLAPVFLLRGTNGGQRGRVGGEESYRVDSFSMVGFQVVTSDGSEGRQREDRGERRGNCDGVGSLVFAFATIVRTKGDGEEADTNSL